MPVVLGLVLTGLPLASILFPLLFGLTVLALDVLRDDIRWQG